MNKKTFYLIFILPTLIHPLSHAGENVFQENNRCDLTEKTSLADLRNWVNQTSNIALPTWETLKPGDFLGTRLFFSLNEGDFNSKDVVSLGSTRANSFDPQVIDGMRLYKVKGTDERIDFTYKRNLTPKDKIYVNLDFFVLTGGKTFLDNIFFTSDNSIEAVHSAIGADDPFQRKSLAIGKPAEFEIRDAQGRTYKIKEGESLFGTLDLGYVHKIDLLKSDKTVVTLLLGGAISASLNHLDSRDAVGTQEQLSVTQKLSKNQSLTLAINAGEVYNFSATSSKSDPRFSDHHGEIPYNGGIFYARKQNNGGTITYGVAVSGNPQPLIHEPDLRKLGDPTRIINDPKSPDRGYLQSYRALGFYENTLEFGLTYAAKSGAGFSLQMGEDFGWVHQFADANNREDWKWRVRVFAPTQSLYILFKKHHK